MTVPGLLEPWNDVRDKWQVATDEFKVSQGEPACCCWQWRDVAATPCIWWAAPEHLLQTAAVKSTLSRVLTSETDKPGLT
jgi:hypothetical protein